VTAETGFVAASSNENEQQQCKERSNNSYHGQSFNEVKVIKVTDTIAKCEVPQQTQ
jgi:hypothetical protein